MNKKILIILTILAFFVFSVFIVLNNNNKIDIPSITDKKESEKESESDKKENIEEEQPPFLDICSGDINDEELAEICKIEKTINKATKNLDASKCLNIKEEFRQRCIIDILKINPDSVDCSLFDGRNNFVCLSEKKYHQAISRDDSDLCLEIKDKIKRANCFNVIDKVDLHGDEDGDGLSFLEEMMHGTNPNLKDSDGDGFNDSEEVKNNYNPVGEGKINQETILVKCNEIEDEDMQILCKQEMDNDTIDLEKCYDIESEELYNYCLSLLESL
ncbi:hypothetical protein K9M50_00435 [Patescibacteria group bacterium]|nr:hypothetical protein [Patescibacteria group bacterium]